MKKSRLLKITLILALAILLSYCKEKNESNSQQVNVKMPKENEAFYYAEETSIEGIQGKNYRFLKINREEDSRVSGITISSPFGTTGMRGSIKGVLDSINNTVNTEITFYSEGSIFSEPRSFIVKDSSIAYVNANSGIDNPLVLPRVSQEEYDKTFKKFKQQNLGLAVNTNDRTRLSKINFINQNFSAEELAEVRFMERLVNLDNNQESQEYLIMVLNPMLCGSGGCNLFVVDENGKTYSNITVTELPIYIPIQTVEDSQQRKGEWNDIFVWSNGMRRLVADTNGKYISNASMGEEVSLEFIQRHPEKYRMVLDYMD